MSTLRELNEIRAEITGLKTQFDSATDAVFQKPLLHSKIVSRERALSELERAPIAACPEAELLFAGGAVNGSLGIDAKFAGLILESYQDMVSNHHGARLRPDMAAAGRRPGESQSRLSLVALPRGSFGLRLAQPHVRDFVAAQQISEVMEELTSLVESAAAGDAAFAQGVERFHPRVLVPLKKFLDTISNNDTSITIRSGLRETALSVERVHAAQLRVATTIEEVEPVSLNGIFRGVLLESWKFDFIPDGQAGITGALAEAVSDYEAQAMVNLVNQRCEARLNQIRFRTSGTLSRPSYELLSVRPLAPALAGG